jgi:dihydropyrimidine dehydrogenase (NAD+) subunit PreT
VVEGGQVRGLKCQVMKLGAPDASGRARPEPTGQEIFLEADMVVAAIGQEKPSGAPVAGLSFDKGFVAVDASLATVRPGVFAGGDAVRSTGAASTVMAVQDGKMAARAIHQYLATKTTATKETVHG